MNVSVSNVIAITSPSKEVMQWCMSNLKIPNPEYNKKLRMNLWLGNTPPDLYLYKIVGNTLILPFGVLRDIIPLLDKPPTTDFKEVVKIDYKANIPLYDYQEKAVKAVIENFYGILQAPAGSGKTQMGIAIIARIGVRTLWLTHTKDLLEQSKSRAEMYIDQSTIGTITEGKINIGTGVTFATIQTMCRMDLSQYKHTWGLIIVDECHRCAGSPTAVTQFYKVLNALAARNKYGLSATVHRSDGMIKATYALLGQVIYSVPREEVDSKIMKVGVCPVGTTTQLTLDCLNTDGTLCYTKLISHLCEDDERNNLIVEHLINDAEHSSLILSDRLNHLQTLMGLLPDDIKSQAVMISGKMTTKSEKAQREQAIEDMRTGKKKYLFATYSLAKEGLDIPCLERLYMVTPQKDYAVVTQSIGRIARICEGKSDPICYDFVDDVHYLFKAYKKRCCAYKKNDCYFISDKGG